MKENSTTTEGIQLDLFPVKKDKAIIKNIDYLDISELPDDFYRIHYNQFSTLPKNTYRIFKTGGYNVYRIKDGPIYPFVQNIKTGKILSAKAKLTDGYPVVVIFGYKNNKRVNLATKIHRVAALAFIENKNNLRAVDHINKNVLDYRIENLRWLSLSDNNKGPKKQKISVDWQNKLEKDGIIR
jgi:hypothetical protein